MRKNLYWIGGTILVIWIGSGIFFYHALGNSKQNQTRLIPGKKNKK